MSYISCKLNRSYTCPASYVGNTYPASHKDTASYKGHTYPASYVGRTYPSSHIGYTFSASYIVHTYPTINVQDFKTVKTCLTGAEADLQPIFII